MIEERLRAQGRVLGVGFLAAAAIVAAFGLIAGEVFSGSDSLDARVSLWARSLQLPGGVAAARAASFFGDWRFLAPATAAVAGALALSGRRVSAMLFAAAVLGGFGLEIVLKVAFHRARPHLGAPIPAPTTYSFPSGHATMATVFFAGLAAVAFHVTRRRAIRVSTAILAAVVIVAVALSRITLGVHWLTDVCAGILVGLFWVAVSATATEVVAGSGRG